MLEELKGFLESILRIFMPESLNSLKRTVKCWV